MKTIADLISEHKFFGEMDQRSLEFVAGCGSNVHFAPGERILTEGEAANTFYVIRSGSVALSFFVPGRGAVVIDTLGDGELVGWSWLFPPYRWQFDAEAREDVAAIAFDGACLRTKCDSDARLGYLLTQRFARVILERLQSVRMRMLDVYGPGVPH
jgi:CRP-like cAMP-binding protein